MALFLKTFKTFKLYTFNFSICPWAKFSPLVLLISVRTLPHSKKFPPTIRRHADRQVENTEGMDSLVHQQSLVVLPQFKCLGIISRLVSIKLIPLSSQPATDEKHCPASITHTSQPMMTDIHRGRNY